MPGASEHNLNFKTDGAESRSNNLSRGIVRRWPTRPQNNCRLAGSWYESGGEPFVAMVQPADLRGGDDWGLRRGWMGRERGQSLSSDIFVWARW